MHLHTIDTSTEFCNTPKRKLSKYFTSSLSFSVQTWYGIHINICSFRSAIYSHHHSCFSFHKEKKTKVKNHQDYWSHRKRLLKSWHFLTGNQDSLIFVIQTERQGLCLVAFLNSWMSMNKIQGVSCTLKANRLSQVTAGLQRLPSLYLT